MRVLAFVLVLLLLEGTVDPTRGWLIVLVVLTGVAAFRLRPWLFGVRPALDVRMASFVLAVMLLADIVDPTKNWLIALAAVTGVAAFMPEFVSLDGRDGLSMRWPHRRAWRWDREFWR